MQLRSRNNSTVSKTFVAQPMDTKTIEICYSSFLAIKYDLLSKLDDFNMEKNHIQKIKKSLVIYKIVDSKLTELKFLKDQHGFSSLKQFYEIIHRKINHLMKEVSTIIMMEEIHLEEENIDLIAEFFQFMLKIRNKF